MYNKMILCDNIVSEKMIKFKVVCKMAECYIHESSSGRPELMDMSLNITGHRVTAFHADITVYPQNVGAFFGELI